MVSLRRDSERRRHYDFFFLLLHKMRMTTYPVRMGFERKDEVTFETSVITITTITIIIVIISEIVEMNFCPSADRRPSISSALPSEVVCVL